MGINTLDRAPTPEEFQQIYFEEGGQVVVDLGQVEEMKFDLIPKGIYRAVLDEVNYGLSKDKGDGAQRYGRFEFIFQLTEAPYERRKLYFYASFSPKTLSGTQTALLRIAPDVFDKKFNPQEVADSGALLGKPVRVKVDHEAYQGVQRAKISYILEAAGETGEDSGGRGGSFFS